MRTVASFEHNGRSVHIRKYAQLGPRVTAAVLYRAYVDYVEIPLSWHNAAHSRERFAPCLTNQSHRKFSYA